jgi:hypothetical protein
MMLLLSKKLLVKNIAIMCSAGITAFIILNMLCLAYDNIPVHISSKTGTTDYIWQKNFQFSKMTEGFGYGKINNEGFNNIQDYNSQKINALLLGSSQMEGTNVPQKKMAVSVLNDLFEGEKYFYNISVSGHDLIHIANNLEAAVKYYRPTEYVIIETMSVYFDIHSLENVLNKSVKPIPSYDKGVIFHLQKIPYLRRIYHQVRGSMGQNDEDEIEQTNIDQDVGLYLERLNNVLKGMSQIGRNTNVKIIILYHPHLILQKDGSAMADADEQHLNMFQTACMNNGIFFVDMTNVFMEAYNTNHILPYGFSNTAVGWGHLNKNGHYMIAKELYDHINKAEQGK